MPEKDSLNRALLLESGHMLNFPFLKTSVQRLSLFCSGAVGGMGRVMSLTLVLFGGAHLHAANVPVALGWGLDDHGQLGLGTQVVFPTPTLIDHTGVLAGKSVVKTVSGGRHVLALTADGKVYAWGDNSSRQLGNNSNIGSSSPVEVGIGSVAGLTGKTVIDIAATGSTSFLLTSDFQLWGWGTGALGGNNPLASISAGLPIRINSGALSGESVVKIACGANHVVALTSAGVVTTFGNVNSNGQLGNNGTNTWHMPAAVVDANNVLVGKTIVDVAANGNVSMARSSDGLLFAWGANSSGQLGVGDKNGRLVPTLVGGSLVGRAVTAMAVGTLNGYAIAADNTLHSWGSNGAGALGLEGAPVTESLIPVAASMNPFSGRTLVSVTASGSSAAVLTAAGEVLTWGNNVLGMLGGQFPTSRSFAQPLSFDSLGTGLTAVSVRADIGNLMTAALSDGRVVIWGHASFGRAGNGVPFLRGGPISVPVTALPNGRIWTQLAAGQNHSLGVDSMGKLYSWGSNSSGQLGVSAIGAPANSPQFVQSGVASFNSAVFSAVAAGTIHSVALTQEGQVFAWGSNSNGQVGDGTFSTRSSAVALATAGTPLAGKTVTQIVAGNNHTLALTTDGVLVAWGLNSNGQVGDSTTTNRNLPTAVLTTGALAGKTVVGVAAGAAASYALTADGLIYAWGSNTSGQLGIGNQISSSVPVSVSTSGAMAGKFITSIFASENNAFAVSSDGTLFAWGANGSSQIAAQQGLGLPELSPIVMELPAGHSHRVPVAVTGSIRHVTVITNDGALFSAGNGSLGHLALGAGEFDNRDRLTHVPGTGKERGIKVLSSSSNGQGGHVLATAEYTTPELVIQHPVGTNLTAGSAAINFGSVAPGTEVLRTIKFSNLGEADLTDLAVSISPPPPAGGSFDIIGVVPDSLSEGQGFTVVVQYSASILGAYSATLQVTSNDPVNPIFNVSLGVEVLTPVSIQTPPAGQTVNVGTPVTLSVVAEGSPTITYQWFKNGQEIENANLANLNLGPVSIADQGNYWVTVANSGSSVTSAPATLLVATEVPVILTQPQSALVKQGDPVTLQVSAIGLPPLRYQWKFKGKDVRGATSATLALPAATLKQAGEYRVVVTSQQSVTSDAAVVGVAAFQGGPRALAAGGKTQATVLTAGGAMGFEWRKDGQSLPADSRITGGDGPTLSIRALDPGTDMNPGIHSGAYTCRITMAGLPMIETEALQLKVFDSQPRLITPVALPPAAIGLDYSTFIPVDPNPQRAPQRFTASGLPPGLKVNPITGEIHGRPLASKPQGYNIKMTASNSQNKAATEATLTVRALPAGATGSFTAVVAPEAEVNGSLGGQMDLKIQPTGAVSGSVRLGAQRLAFKGVLNTTLASDATAATLAIPRKGRAALLLTLEIDDTVTPDPLTGQIADPEALGAGVAPLSGWRYPWTKDIKPAAFAGTHTLALLPPDSESGNLLLPQGIGFGSFTVGANGKLRVTGRLADGQGFAVPAFVGARGQIAVHQALYGGKVKGSLSGRCQVTSGSPLVSPAGNRLGGDLVWTRPADLSGRSRLYPAGFSLLPLGAQGGGYVPPGADGLLLGLTAPADTAELAFEAALPADLPTSPDISVRLLPRGGVQLPATNPTGTTLRTVPKTGALSGGFTVLDGGVRRAVKFQGQVVPLTTGSVGVGYFLLPELGAASPQIRSGTVTLGPP